MKIVTVKQTPVLSLLIPILFFSNLQAQESFTEDAFFLDLGIVIELGTGKEEINRLIKAPSEQVKFFLDKEPSGSVFMASTKELQLTLERITKRMESLENSIYSLEGFFEKEVNTLKSENSHLREMISDLLAQEPVVPPALEKLVVRIEEVVSDVEQLKNKSSGETNLLSVTGIAPIEKPKVIETEMSSEYVERQSSGIKDKTEDLVESDQNTLEEQKSFSKLTYMAAVFAYQRDDYQSALRQFRNLSLMDTEDITAGNVLYWMADCYFQLGEYDEALSTLEQIRKFSESDKLDDALVLSGLSYRRMGKESRAVSAFSDVVINYPESEYYRLAQMELKKSEMRP